MWKIKVVFISGKIGWVRYSKVDGGILVTEHALIAQDFDGEKLPKILRDLKKYYKKRGVPADRIILFPA